MPATRTKGHTRSKDRYSRDYSHSVQRVLELYISACRNEPIGAASIDPHGECRPRTNPFKMTEYKVDVERSFADALRNHSHLVGVLQNLLKEMAAEPFEPIAAGDRVALIQRLGPVFARLGLTPFLYFSRSTKERG